LPENVGFGRAVNLAARRTSAPLLLLLNPDAEVRPGAIDVLIDLSRDHPEAGIYGGRTVAADGKPDGLHCWGLPSLWSLLCFATGLSVAGRGSKVFDPEAHGRWPDDRPYEVDAVSGAFLLITAAAWQRLGGFDEDYFLYAEDLDLCARARDAGYRPLVTPHAEVVHALGASSAVRADRRVAVLRGKATYLRKRWPMGRARLGLALLGLGVALRAAVARVLGAQMRSSEWQAWPDVWRQRHVWLAGYPTGTRSATGIVPAERPSDS
jgi:GT2 family glycosyltransferase